ncbi:flagellar hook-associated protein FlgK [Oceanidesulfovibrio indonesiensis]|uniref:Flagellar hook-associated protein 1 n=1 Tax=Oceanidesulfovibrio indonesiensis TaxID=54767 RepID=A0A7M3MCV7_9BACT|nr:flagellar hook-associated protein FlgK [Oceanidesulfovibrio indonesiensis]TVM15938.1 flagellar hook-associated protein FlgK [Oceanidesulfovibrio indonesiensis]
MINSLLSLGEQALMNAQVGISVTGNNIANIDTAGYARRTVTYATNGSISVNGVSIGTGASVEQIRRNYDTLLESSYLAANSQSAAWAAMAKTLYNVESLFNQSDNYGVSTALDTFLNSLAALEDTPRDAAARQELLSYAETLVDSLAIIDASLKDSLASLEKDVASGVVEANALMKQIAQLNADITRHPDNLELQDQRDTAIRALSDLVDVQVLREDDTNVTVLTTSGQPLVDGIHAYELSWEQPQVQTDLIAGSDFDGALYFSGTSSDELLVQFTSAGPADGSASAATFRVSMDGGNTWLTDEDGAIMEFRAGGYDDRVEVAGVELWFGQSHDSSATATTDISAKDSFSVMPKYGLYWHATTGGKVNITPIEGNGANNRLSGGKLAGLITARDEGILAYAEELDALAHELIWQMNFQHSQGAGLEHYVATTASYQTKDTTAPLAASSLPYASRLQSGGLAFAFYNESTGESLGVESLDFSTVTPGTATFDPETHSLQDVVDAINASFPGLLQASIQDGRLQLSAEDGVEFEFAGDSSGLLAALGLNTFFSGSDVSNMAIDSRVATNTNRINAAVVDGSGAVAAGDNSNALALAALADKSVTLDCLHSSTSQSIAEHLHALTAKVGADTDTAARNYTLTSTLAADLNARQEEVAGVSMDEELTNLMRYQQAYQAASRLIQTTSEMFDTLMSLKS